MADREPSPSIVLVGKLVPNPGLEWLNPSRKLTTDIHQTVDEFALHHVGQIDAHPDADVWILSLIHI